MVQYQHVGINITDHKYSTGIVFNVVNSEHLYTLNYGTQIVEDMLGHNGIVHRLLGLELASFCDALSKLYHRILFKYNGHWL